MIMSQLELQKTHTLRKSSPLPSKDGLGTKFGDSFQAVTSASQRGKLAVEKSRQNL